MGYTGEIGVILINHSSVSYTIESGDKIAQLVFAPYAEANGFDLVEMLDDTERGECGFGSTGVK